MRISLAGLAVLAPLVLCACGGSGGAPSTQASQPAAATTAATGTGQTASAGATSTSTSTSTSSSSAPGTTTAAPSTGANGANGANGGASVGGAASQCRAAGLVASFLGGQGATGHGELGFALRNTGAACSTGGYPGIQFLAQDGAALPTTPTHTTSDFFGHLPLGPLTVAPGRSVSFRLGVSHGGGSGAACSTAYAVQVIAPNDTATLRVPIPNGASECGTTTVSPLQPGYSAYP